MKKTLLFIMALLLSVGVKAQIEWGDKNWSTSPKAFSWNQETLLEAGNEAIAIGDMITVTFTKTTTEPATDATVALNSVYTQVVSQYYDTSASPSSVSFIISARERDVFRRFGMNLTGLNITVTAVTKSSSGYTGGNNSIWVGSSNGWSNIALNAVKDIKAGDRIVVNMSKTGSNNDFDWGYVDSGWTSHAFESTSYTKSDTKAELKVTSDLATAIRAGQGLYIQGQSNYTYTSIDLITEDQTATQIYTPASPLSFEGNSNFDLPTEYFKGLSVGDKMIVTVTDISGTVAYGGTGEDKDAVYHRLGLAEQNWAWVGWISDYISATGDIEIDITAQMLSASKALPLKIHGSNCVISKIEFQPANVNISISGAKYATYSCEQPLDFTGSDVKAYVASNATSGTVTLKKVTEVPANTGILVYCETAGTYQIPIATAAPAAPATNYFVANTLPTSIAASSGSTWNYIFAKKGSDVGFYKLTAAHILGAHKAFLQTDTDLTPDDPSSAIALIFDDEETTGVNEVRTTNFTNNTNEYFNLAGQRVAKPTKGLYIVNGKKVIIK